MEAHDLFSLPDPKDASRDPRQREIEMRAEEPTGPRMVSSPEEMARLFVEMVEKEMPAEPERDRLWASENRRRKEVDVFPITSIVGAVTPHGFCTMVHERLSKDNEGSFLNTLVRTQGNGVWVPVRAGTRQGARPSLTGVREAKHRLPTDMMVPDEVRHLENVPTREDTLEYVIWYVDAAGATDIRYDLRGNPVTEMDVSVRTGMDPGVAAAMQAQAEGVAKLAEGVAKLAARPTDADLRRAAEAEVDAIAPEPAESDKARRAKLSEIGRKGAERRWAKKAPPAEPKE